MHLNLSNENSLTVQIVNNLKEPRTKNSIKLLIEMSRCIIANCFIQSTKLFSSPTDPIRLAFWKKILNIEYEINEFNICAEHFEVSFFDNYAYHLMMLFFFQDKFLKIEKKLTPEAFPTKFITSVSNLKNDGSCQVSSPSISE